MTDLNTNLWYTSKQICTIISYSCNRDPHSRPWRPRNPPWTLWRTPLKNPIEKMANVGQSHLLHNVLDVFCDHIAWMGEYPCMMTYCAHSPLSSCWPSYDRKGAPVCSMHLLTWSHLYLTHSPLGGILGTDSMFLCIKHIVNILVIHKTWIASNKCSRPSQWLGPIYFCSPMCEKWKPSDLMLV